MAIALSSSGSQLTASGSAVITVGIAADDFLIAGYATDNASEPAVTYGSPLVQDTVNHSDVDGQSFYAGSGKATGSAASLTSTIGDNMIGILGAFSGVDTSTQLDAAVVTASTGSGSATTDTGALNITTASANAMLVLLVGVDGTSTTDPTFSVSDGGAGLSWSYVTGYSTAFRKLVFAYAIKPTAGAIAVTGAFGLSAGFGAALYALKPAAGSSPVLAESLTTQTFMSLNRGFR